MAEGKKYKILIVDDDKFLLNMYSLKFSKEGHQIETATSGAEAFGKIEGGFAPDILMLDIVMPGIDGLQIAEKVKKEKLVENPIIVMLTNQGIQTDIEKAKSIGVQGYIVKATTIPSEVVEEVTKIAQAHGV